MTLVSLAGYSFDMKELIREVKDYGFKIAIGNQLIGFTKWFVRAKRIRLSYK